MAADEMSRHLKDTFGDHVVDVSVPTDRGSGLPRGFAFVTFSRPEEATSAIARLNGMKFASTGKKMSVKEVKARTTASGGKGRRGQSGWGGGGWAGPGAAGSEKKSGDGGGSGGSGGGRGGRGGQGRPGSSPTASSAASVLGAAAAVGTTAMAAQAIDDTSSSSGRISLSGEVTADVPPAAPAERASDFYSRLAGGGASLMDDYGAFDPSSFEASKRAAKRAHGLRNQEREAEAAAAKRSGDAKKG